MGNGMVMMTCYNCDEQGRLLEAKPDFEAPPSIATLDRRSQSYKKAIQDIMELNPLISRDEAVKIFDNEYQKK
jgi:hypothetical protein